MKALITGSLGFVGRYMREELKKAGYDVMGIDVRPAESTIECNLLDEAQTLQAIERINPDVIIHLAGQADVGKSWKIPQKTFEINVVAAINLMEAVRKVNTKTKMVLVGSSDEYGQLGKLGEDVTEDIPLNPQTPYAVSKRAQEQMAAVYVRSYGMNICMTRSFNHAGVGQREGFLIPDFASGIARVEKGMEPCLKVGNLDSCRDFTHVRDVVRAYRLIAEKGHSGEVYNVGSGKTYRVQDILETMCNMSKCEIRVEEDPNRMRPSDTPIICCNHDKLTKDTDWEPKLGMDSILGDVLAEWREKLL